MFLFVIYGVLAWGLAAKWRRQWRGYIAVAASFFLLLFISRFYTKLSRWTGGRIDRGLMQVLVYPYILLVVAGGLFLVSLPRSKARRPGHCARCDYDLTSLDPMPLPARQRIASSDPPWPGDEPIASSAVICPECGLAHEPGTFRSLDELREKRELDLIRARSATRHQAQGPPPGVPPSSPTAAA